MNARLAALSLGIAAAALSLSACNLEINAGNAGSSGPSAPADQKGVGAKPGGRPGANGPTRCLSTELSASVRPTPHSSEESQRGVLTLTNKSRRTCVIPAGWAVIGYGAPGAYRNLNAERRSVPTPAKALVLRPGASAYAGTFWGTSPEPSCVQRTGGAHAGLAVLWWGDWIRAGGRIGAPCNGGAIIGTFQAHGEGLNVNP